MADVIKFNISGGVAAVAVTAAGATAAEQTVVTGKDNRLALRVANGNEAGITVRLKAGEGPRAPLGDNDVVVAAESTAYIALYDTARYMKKTEEPVDENPQKIRTVGKIAVALMDVPAEGEEAQPLGEPALGLVQLEAVQL